MTATIDYYLAPQSPWAYLGHARLARIARDAGAELRVRPVDFGGQIFPATGGLPLAQRPVQRQAYRLVELKRFADWLGLPLNLKPKFFPVAGDAAARLIIAVDAADGSDAAMAITGRILAACWAEERDIASAATLAELLAEAGMPAARLDESREPVVEKLYGHYTRQALAAGVFGAPSYLVDGEIFWGQDRLDFLRRRLEQP